ncbi:PaaI family thioesterase [Streptomyces cylindrosporus]|uniref:Medium/long-chain acyl-CoA thioesterase YigI n=1 Tax=Streptomyces cylindrosporus TaxID=2927583 RepID=A0ABS9YMA7_9ACTN|nr:PaaI family thioesterase [Streptomyces cylindrosporus]MCI3278319.1 PaaI family thioesterase [Streptomyces cylindrosporus]
MDLELARKILAEQPFSRLLGARITAFGEGTASLELDVREELLQQYGFVHGGVLSYAADNTLTLAAGTVVGSGLITSGFTIDYLRPATGRLLRAHGEVVRAGRTRVVSRCDVVTVDGEGTETLCAVAQGNIAVIEPVAGKG